MTLYELLPTRKTRRSSQLAATDRVDPFAYLQRRTNHLFEDFFRDFAIEPSHAFADLSQGFVPRVDITETEKDLVISAELPGVDEKDVELSLDQGVLTIRGEKKQDTETKDEDYYCKETFAGSFQRSLQLPSEVDQEKAAAKFKKGILTITLPKVVQEKPTAKKIEIKGT